MIPPQSPLSQFPTHDHINTTAVHLLIFFHHGRISTQDSSFPGRAILPGGEAVSEYGLASCEPPVWVRGGKQRGGMADGFGAWRGREPGQFVSSNRSQQQQCTAPLFSLQPRSLIMSMMPLQCSKLPPAAPWVTPLRPGRMRCPDPTMTHAEDNIKAAFDARLEKCKRINYRKQFFYHVDAIKTWMLKASGRNNVPNSAKLLHAVSNPNAFAATGPNEIKNALILFAILLKLDCGHLIHIFQQHFHDDSLDSTIPTAILTQELEESNLEYPGDILQQFDEERWAFCPARIEHMHNHTKSFYGGHWILPFCAREPINEGGTAHVDRVLLQEDLVPDDVEFKKELEGFEYIDKKYGRCYQFAIKSFRAEAQNIFQTEISNFHGIKSLPGVVKYFGHYKMEDYGEDKILRTTHNILLEFGDLDLDEYLAVRYPPVLNAEIIAFWEDIFSVAATLDNLHNFKYERGDGATRRFNGWHGDLKPSNILWVKGKFKLADFGFAKFEPNQQGKDPLTELDGLTHTYGAPECDPGRIRRQTKTQHTQEIDTWSLGCVLSSIATWVVLGSFAYDQYHDIRKLAIEDLKGDPTFSPPKATDCFHDGRHILGAVKSWHKYLLNSMRKSDTITGDVLRFVENHMLLSNPKDRWPSTAVVKGLRDIVVTAKARYEEALRNREMPDIPAETLKALLDLDNTAPPDVHLEARVSEPLKDRRATTILEQRSRPRTTRIKKSDRLTEMVVPAKVAGRQEVLESALSEKGESYTRIGVIFESPTTKATESSLIPDEWQLNHPLAQSKSPTRPKVAVNNSEEYQRNTPMSARTRNSADKSPIDSPTSPTFKPGEYGLYSIGEASHSGPGDPGSQVPRHSRQGSKDTYRTSTTHPYPDPRYSVGPGQPVMSRRATALIDNETEHYPIAELHRSLTKLWNDNRDVLSVLRNKIPADKKLRDFIKDRDIKFVVDNGWSMRAHWKRAKLVLETLAMKVGPLDENGLDLLFPRGDYGKENVKGFDIPTEFRKAMNEAKAEDDPELYQTPMAGFLNKLLSQYRTNMSKKLTIIILTTGEWEESKTPDDVERVIAEHLRHMSAVLPNFDTERHCTFEFVSFGDNGQALQRLKDLDDEFSQKYNLPDVIDTEPWNGNPYQMLLGSIKSSMDGKNSRVPNSPVGYGAEPGASASAIGEYQPMLRPPSPPKRLSRSPSRSSSSFLGKMEKVPNYVTLEKGISLETSSQLSLSAFVMHALHVQTGGRSEPSVDLSVLDPGLVGLGSDKARTITGWSAYNEIARAGPFTVARHVLAYTFGRVNAVDFIRQFGNSAPMPIVTINFPRVKLHLSKPSIQPALSRNHKSLSLASFSLSAFHKYIFGLSDQAVRAMQE
ncbi:hypothetical protein V8F20_004952 [Naviculisporaceae sp. PSN 640]